MTSSLRTDTDYELFLYSLVDLFPSVQRSTITFVRLGASLARVAGELYFAHGFYMAVRQPTLNITVYQPPA